MLIYKTMDIVIIGPPGSGKGTQAKLLAKKIGICNLSVGFLLRQEVEQKTDLGIAAEAHLDKGEMVDDDLVNEMVARRLKLDDCKDGYLLDGYPRRLHQAEFLENHRAPEKVIFIDLPDDVIYERLGGRRSCPECGAIFHTSSKPPRVDGVCDKCGGKLIVRSDNQPETIKRRIELYHELTPPIIDFCKDKLIRVNGDQSIEELFSEICRKLSLN